MLPEFAVLGHRFVSYNVFAYLGAAVGAALSWRPLRRAGFSPWGAVLLLLAMCAGFLAGARLWNVAVAPDNYGGSLRWYSLRLAGLSLYGGILGLALVLIAAFAVKRRPILPTLDDLVIPTAASFCLSRVGCFLNGCCAGVKTGLPWGVIFPDDLPQITIGGMTFGGPKPVHPTQLYELLLAAVGVPLAVWLAKKWRLPAGGRFLLYGVWFCALRLGVLPLRSLSYRSGVTEVFYPALYGCLILTGVWSVLYLRRRGTSQ